MKTENFLSWLSAVDNEKLTAVRDRKAWAVMLLFFTLAIFVCSKIDVIYAFTELEWQGPLFCLFLVAIHAFIVSAPDIRERLGSVGFGVLALSTSLFFQIFMWSMVCFSGLQAAPMMAVLPILLAAYHAELFQLSTKYLWSLFAILGAIIVAMFLAPTQDHFIIVSIGSLFSIAACFTMGNYALVQAKLLNERNNLKEAFEAQNLMESVNETEKAKDLLHEMLGTNHDAGNALTGVLMNIELLNMAVKEPNTDKLEDIEQVNQDIYSSVQKLKSVIEKGRNVGRQAHIREMVNVKDSVEDVIKDLKLIFQDRNIKMGIEDLGDASFIGLHGGVTTFSRILTNLIKNACEGNGKIHAANVDVEIKRRNDHVLISVIDDGPGFKQHQLEKSHSIYDTSKANGTGLGLYTCQRLVMANNGTLRLANNSNIGATVTVSLPVESSL